MLRSLLRASLCSWCLCGFFTTESRSAQRTTREIKKCQKLGNKLIEANLTEFPPDLACRQAGTSGLGSSKIVISRESGVQGRP